MSNASMLWQTKQLCSTKKAPSPSRMPLALGDLFGRLLVPQLDARDEARGRSLSSRQLIASMARASASFDWRFSSGMMLAGTTVVGDLKCLMCQLKIDSWSVARLEKSNSSACLSPTLVRSGPSRPPCPLTT